MLPPPTKIRHDWASLPADALELISRRLTNDADYVRLRSVCTWWRYTTPKRPQLLWLLARYSQERRNFNSASTKLNHFPKSEIFSPAQMTNEIAQGKFIVGISRGYIFFVDDAAAISLHNPFTGVHIQLPSLAQLRQLMSVFGVRKTSQGFELHDSTGRTTIKISFANFATKFANQVTLSSDPVTAPQDCVVMANFDLGEKLIYCRPGNGSWTVLSPTLPSYVSSISFYKGKFYAASRYRVFVCDIDNAQTAEISPANPLFSDGQNRRTREVSIEIGPPVSYLVMSSGELLLAVTISNPDFYGMKFSWEIFRVDFDDGKLRLFKLENLGGRSLFLDGVSMPVSVDGSCWCRGNCIYYLTSAYKRSGEVVKEENIVKVFNMEDGSTSVIAVMDGCWGAHWLMPNLGY